MTRFELITEVHGKTFHDVWTIYPCRHIHFKWSMDGEGPKRAKRLKAGSVHYKRLKKLMEVQ